MPSCAQYDASYLETFIKLDQIKRGPSHSITSKLVPL